VNRRFSSCAILTFLWSSTCFAQDAPATESSRPKLSISVHNYADVPAELLLGAEEEAHEIFEQAGLETVWLNCSPKMENTQPAGCYVTDRTHFVLKLLRHAVSKQVRNRSDVLGVATLDQKGVGYYGYVFYDRVQKLAEAHQLSHRLLGDVLAHELGHLLLGSTAHSISGLMSGQWSGEGLRRVSEGAMFFAPSESRVMRDRLGSGGDRHNCMGSSARTPGTLSGDPPISTVREN
jgi:predicted Zn-dependent protease